jgi:ABC-type antimicrobial peptide transport system permease subunit
MYSTSSIYTSLVVKDSNFVDTNKDYLIIQTKKNKVDDYFGYEENLKAEYILPGDSKVKMNLKYDNFYQGSIYTVPINGSLSSLEMIDKNDIVYGRWPENENEIVVDKLTLKKSLKEELTKMIGLSKNEDFMDKNIFINNMPNMKIVGLVDKSSPSIYVDRSKMINLVYHLSGNEVDDIDFNSISTNYSNDYEDYNLFNDKITLKEGRWPENDYEVIVPYSNKEYMKLNKQIDRTINDRKLTVVGYYTSKDNYNYYFVNPNTIKINTILSSSSIAVYSKNKEETIEIGRKNYNLNIKDSYKSSREKYVNSRRESVKVSLISSGIILAISLIEILLMMRSSFLSRIKEVGTYRAIGVKKKDIYIMFSGEIIAITTIASIPGILICAYVIKKLSEIPDLSDYFMINGMVVISSILLVFIFNLIVGLIPVFNTIRKRPAEILSRTDI